MSEPEFAVCADPGRLHFNAAHFITLNNACENLHGHNFRARAEVFSDRNQDGFIPDSAQLAELAADICTSPDDKALLPGRNVVTLEHDNGWIHVKSFDRCYTLPANNRVVSPISNATAELLAWYACGRLLRELQANSGLGDLRRLRLAIEKAGRRWGIYQREVNNVR